MKCVEKAFYYRNKAEEAAENPATPLAWKGIIWAILSIFHMMCKLARIEEGRVSAEMRACQ